MDQTGERCPVNNERRNPHIGQDAQELIERRIDLHALARRGAR